MMMGLPQEPKESTGLETREEVSLRRRTGTETWGTLGGRYGYYLLSCQVPLTPTI